MARPNWEYIRVDVLLTEHPKLDGLSPIAKWTLIELWCYCGRHRTDGHIGEGRWKTFGTKAAREQLLHVPPGYKHGFVEKVVDGYLVHDFVGPDGHQRTRAEIDELSAKRTESARKAAAARWGGDAKTHTKPHVVPDA
jgi:hypothetical protein